MRWTLVLERKSENSLNADIVRRHLQQVASTAERLGFRSRVGKLGSPEAVLEDGGTKKRYLVRLRLEGSGDEAAGRFPHVRAAVEKAARVKGWAIVGEGAAANDPQGAVLASLLVGPRPPFRPIELTSEVLATHFADVYDREPQLRIINDAVQTAALTQGAIRAHVLLFGLPGGAKSSLLERLKPLYDDEVERMVFMDATTMTKAGLETWLLEQAEARTMPEIIVFEEIEKVENKENLLCLGSAMASGWVMRVNARIGRVQVPAKFLVIATCNDEEALKAFRRGFLWDRFTNQTYCPLPDRDTMRRILLDKVARIPGGRPEWADRALELADKLGAKSPRKIIGYLAGRHRLDTMAYQMDQIRVFVAERREKAAMQEAS